MSRLAATVGLILVTLLVVFDSRSHFSKELVELKQKHRSDQRNWNIFYSQMPAYKNAALRYQDDFAQIRRLVDPGSLLLSDLASSYHAAAALPVYIVNVHRHHGRGKHLRWMRALDDRVLCYLDAEDRKAAATKLFQQDESLRYVLLNHDKETEHRRRDCLSARSSMLSNELPQFATRLYRGEFLELYEIDHLPKR